MDHTKVFVVFGVVAGLALVGAITYQGIQKNRTKAGAPPAAASAIPPADAEFIDADPGGLVSSASSIRNPAQRAAAAAELEGLWVSNEGWNLEVEDVTREVGGYAVRCYVYGGGVISGCWVVAVVPDNAQNVEKHDRATVQGRIAKVEIVNTPPVPTYRVLLQPARVLSVQKTAR